MCHVDAKQKGPDSMSSVEQQCFIYGQAAEIGHRRCLVVEWASVVQTQLNFIMTITGGIAVCASVCDNAKRSIQFVSGAKLNMGCPLPGCPLNGLPSGAPVGLTRTVPCQQGIAIISSSRHE